MLIEADACWSETNVLEETMKHRRLLGANNDVLEETLKHRRLVGANKHVLEGTIKHRRLKEMHDMWNGDWDDPLL